MPDEHTGRYAELFQWFEEHVQHTLNHDCINFDEVKRKLPQVLAALDEMKGVVENLQSLMPKVCDLCTHHGSSPESIEDFDKSGEDQWIADLWRAALAARKGE